MPGGWQSRILGHIHAGIRTQSMDFMLVLLGLPAGLAALFGPVESKALDRSLHPVMVKAWAISLIIGCLMWLWGVLGVRLYGDVVAITRMAPYRLGLHLLAVAALVYGIAILISGGWGGVLASWPLFAFSSTTYLKSADLYRIMRRSREAPIGG